MSRYKEFDEKGKYQWELFRKRGSESLREDRMTQYYPFYFDDERLRIPELEWNEKSRIYEILEEPRPSEGVAWPIDEEGVERRWRWSISAVKKDISQFKVKINKDGVPTIYYKYRPQENGVTATTVWFDSKYSATEHGTGALKALFGANPFSYPKSIYAVMDCLRVSKSNPNSVLDFFAGSGTTGHAVINLNREDGGDRKYILIEMGEHFDTVLVPRLKKVIYSKDWKDGKPQSRNTGISHCFKILRLESYEDTLNNLRLHRSREQELALEAFSPQAKEDYQLGYMLDLEARGSQSLLNVAAFTDPWNYTLEIASGTAGEPSWRSP
jgi:adenine-specific DNA-methyltransferase